MLIKGEKAKDKRVGAMVLLIREQTPNTAPRIAPAQVAASILVLALGKALIQVFRRMGSGAPNMQAAK